MNISHLGEFELIARLTSNLSTRRDVALGVGDDCAVLDLGGDRLLLATCDSQVEEVHFTLRTSLPEQIGHKALAINLSDIAAMGGEPRYALVSLILPTQLPLTVLDGIYAGLRAEAERFSTVLIGGNIASTGQSERLIIDITLLGEVERGRVLTRSGAKVGDLLCVTGGLGDSAAGLDTLLHADQQHVRNAVEFVQAVHTMPRPRVREGRVLNQFGPAIVTALIDVSDGVSGDLEHLCTRSKVGACIDLAQLPLSQAMQTIAARAQHNPWQWALHGGEDYELLFTVEPGNASVVIEAVLAATGTSVTIIGSILPPDEGLKIRYPDGHEEPLNVQSWNHLKQ